MFRIRLTAMVLVLIGLVAACGSEASTGTGGRRYVAIGDSYVSGPQIDVQDPKSPTCVRSNRNYPHLMAKKLKLKNFVDVSCGGETTVQLQNGRMGANGALIDPQLDAITPATRLVTVGIGANDAGLYLRLFLNCLVTASAKDANCATFADTYAPTVYSGTQERVAAILSAVKKRAPKARVLLVGYLRIVPDSGKCSVLPISETNRAKAMQVEVALTGVLRDAARAADVTFVDVRSISHGHDACAGKEAWVNGASNVPGDGALLHPNEAGMRAVANQVLKAVGKF